MPTENGLTILDADTQETSYGTLVVDGLPLIFDTHRKDSWYVSSVEMLTEVRKAVAVPSSALGRFVRAAARRGVLATPYSGCFFKGNLHVYAFDGHVRGLDLSVAGPSVNAVEATLESRSKELWNSVPAAIIAAQRSLLEGRRQARYNDDLDVLIQRRRASSGHGADRAGKGSHT
jgi:hypothetical protein